jgi:putative ABC transport system ATP-binding protein
VVSIIFADEPTGNLDSVSTKEIVSIFKKLNKDGITIIMVTHEADIASQTKRTIRLRDGEVVSQ